jgi:hypothetical protein
LRPNLVIARVGDKSLHPRWIEGERNFDLALSSFGSTTPVGADQCVHVEHVKGPKWRPLYDLLKEKEDLVRQYAYVSLPDDDLLFSGPAMSRFFDLCQAYRLPLAQPSLDYDSFYSHPITVHRPLLTLRYTNFVEAMIPTFRTDILYDLLETFPLSASGWGLDSLWAGELAKRGEKLAIVDAVSVTHTRPVGGELYKGGSLAKSPFDDLEVVFADQNAVRRPALVGAIAHRNISVPRTAVRLLGLVTRARRRRDGAAQWIRNAPGPMAAAASS